VNPFEGPRRVGYPVPPLREGMRNKLFAEACERLGYHPYPTPNGILSQAYQPATPYDARIPERKGCVYCAQCNNYGCHVQAKTASPFTVIPVALETGNFDHAGLGFIRGATIGISGGGPPLERYDVLPPGMPRWGAEYKEFLAYYYTRGFDVTMHPETLPHRDNYLDLDPVHKDEWGLPLPRSTSGSTRTNSACGSICPRSPRASCGRPAPDTSGSPHPPGPAGGRGARSWATTRSVRW